MADRIERYLGRLESELEGRVEDSQIAELLVEVEGHLRESEEAYIELGEPSELANRLAVDGFSGLNIIHKTKPYKLTAPQLKRSQLALASICGVMPFLWFADEWLGGKLNVPMSVYLAFFAGAVVYGMKSGSSRLRVSLTGLACALSMLLLLFAGYGRVGNNLDGSTYLGMKFGSRVISRGAVRNPMDLQPPNTASLPVKEGQRYLTLANKNLELPRLKFEQIWHPVKLDSEGGYALVLTKNMAIAQSAWIINGPGYIKETTVSENNVNRWIKYYDVAGQMPWIQRVWLFVANLGSWILPCIVSICACLGLAHILAMALEWLRQKGFGRKLVKN